MTDDRYKDIIGLEHHTSAVHPRMPREARAAQFSPFAALTGFGEVIEETGRLTEVRTELAEDERKALDAKFRALAEDPSADREILVTFFKEDPLKEGGAYLTVSGRIRKVDEIARCIVLEDGISIPMADVFGLGIKEQE